MNNSLIAPISERVTQNVPKEQIKKDVIELGYTEEEFEAAYIAATTGPVEPVQVAAPPTMQKSYVGKAIRYTLGGALLLLVTATAGFYALDKLSEVDLPSIVPTDELDAEQDVHIPGIISSSTQALDEETRASTSDERADDADITDTQGEVSDSRHVGWQTYHNIQFAFEVQYPKDWSVREFAEGAAIRNYTNTLIDAPDQKREINIRYYLSDNPELLDINAWLDESFGAGFFSDVTKRDVFVLNGHEAVRLQRLGEDANNTVYIRRGSDIVSAVYEIDPEYDTSYNDILSTLHLVAFDEEAYSALLKQERVVLLGRDADGDGVWDYIQSYIEKTYPTSSSTQAVLTQYAIAIQKALLDHRDKEASLQHAVELSNALRCMFYLTEDVTTLHTNIRAHVLNTKARSDAYLRYNGQLGGSSATASGSDKQGCAFDPDKMPH